MKRTLISSLLLTGFLSTFFASEALAYVKIGGRFTQDPLNAYYYNSTGTSVKTIDQDGTFYYSHWLEVQHALDKWNNTQNTKVWFLSTSDQSKSILDFEDAYLKSPDYYGQTSMWNGTTQLSVDQTHTTYWYWAKVEINVDPSTPWRNNSITSTRSNTTAVGKLQHVAAHEMGHALGLDHVSDWSWNEDKLMYPTPIPYYKNGIVGPTTDEVSGVQAIYGTLN